MLSPRLTLLLAITTPALMGVGTLMGSGLRKLSRQCQEQVLEFLTCRPCFFLASLAHSSLPSLPLFLSIIYSLFLCLHADCQGNRRSRRGPRQCSDCAGLCYGGEGRGVSPGKAEYKMGPSFSHTLPCPGPQPGCFLSAQPGLSSQTLSNRAGVMPL